MTARQVYEAMLIEMNKVEAPSMLLEDFNYFFNKAIYQYINKKYNIYDVNQQTTDDIRVLKATAVIYPETNNSYNAEDSLYGGVVAFNLPEDYLHILNCICDFKVNRQFKCYNKDSHVQFAARRLTSDMWSQIINNFYMRPMYRRPYYFIHNVNILPKEEVEENNKVYISQFPTDTFQPRTEENGKFKTDTFKITRNENDPSVPLDDNSGLNRTITIENKKYSNVERESNFRYGNSEPIRLEIRYGKDSTVFKLEKIYIDYIKTPQHIRLTQEQLDLTEDTSQMLEFPDYVCQEIINELVKLMMENASDPRLQTNIPINQTIAQPVQQSQSSKK